MTEKEAKRLKEIDDLLVYVTKEKNNCLKDNNIKKAEIYRDVLFRLIREREDILNGYKSIMNERKEELLNKVEKLSIEYLNSNFFGKIRLDRVINKVYEDMKESNLREYAKTKVKTKKNG